MQFIKKLIALLILNAPTLILVSLKLSGSIDWNWWMVTIFMWLPIAFLAALLLFVLVLMLSGVAVAGSIFAMICSGLKKSMKINAISVGAEDDAVDAEYIDVG